MRSLSYFVQATVYVLLALSNGNSQTAESSITRAQAEIHRAHTAKDPAAEARALNSLARIYQDAGNNQQAVTALSQALSLENSPGHRSDEFATLNARGEAYRDLGQLQQALEDLNKAIVGWRELKDRNGEAASLNNLASVYFNKGEVENAVKFGNLALAIWKAEGDRSGQASALTNLGEAYSVLGDSAKAFSSLQEALAFCRDLHDLRCEGATLSALGDACNNNGDPHKALNALDQALPLRRANGDLMGEGKTLSSMGEAHYALGDAQSALGFYQQALALEQKVSDLNTEAATLHDIGAAYASVGQPEKALEYYQRALLLERQVQNKVNESITLHAMGTVAQSTGQTSKALELYNQALPMEQASGNRNAESITLHAIGQLYDDRGEPQRALEYYGKALTTEREIGDKRSEGTTLSNMGAAFQDLSQSAKALELLNQALPLLKSVGDEPQIAITLHDIGAIQAVSGQPDEARASYLQALQIERKSGDRDSEAFTLWRMSQLAGDNGLSGLLASLRIAQQVEDYDLQGYVNTSLMDYWSGKKPELAIFFGRNAVNNYQQIRSNMVAMDKELERSFVRSKSSAYRKLADLLVQQNRLAEAEKVLDLLKEQELRELVRGNESGAAPHGSPLPVTDAERRGAADLTAEEQLATDLVAAAEERRELENKTTRTAQEDGRLSELNGTVTNGNKAVLNFLNHDLYSDLRASSNAQEANALIGNVQEESTSIRNELRHLSSDTVAVYSVITENHGYLILITSAARAKYEIAMPVSELRSTILSARRALEDPTSDPRAQLRSLYNALFEPLEGGLAASHAHTILWSLDGVLRYIPVNALYDGQHYLIEKYSNVAITPASRNHLLDSPAGAGSQILAMGLSKSYLGMPPLNSVDDELKSIVHDPEVPASHGYASGRLIEDNAFTFSALRDLASKYPIVHIASHFVYSWSVGREPYLLLAGQTTGGPGYRLTLSEMSSALDFTGVRLLTLAACNTAIPDLQMNGREMDSLSMVAQQNDAAAVISTVWDVDDSGTSSLMADFYKRWLSDTKLSKAEALRQAQLDMLHGGGVNVDKKAAPGGSYAHPYYWAPFVLTGNFQ